MWLMPQPKTLFNASSALQHFHTSVQSATKAQQALLTDVGRFQQDAWDSTWS